MEKFWYNDTQLILADRKASKHIRKFDTGGKKNMKKRFLSIVLAVLMLVSVLPTTAFAEESAAPQKNVVRVEKGGVKVEKKAEWIGDGKDGKAKITFTLTGGTMTSQDIPETDIVLVIDKSASMSKNGSPKMNNAKKAAVSFVDKFFGTGADQGYKNKVQIAVVSYVIVRLQM